MEDARALIVPSDTYPHALGAIVALAKPGVSIRAAVAFVTGSGVAELASVLSQFDGVRLEVAARAADATEPEALLELRDALGADVTVVIGKHARTFHPKLWLIEGGDGLVVLSGSGNLTAAGLTTNDEQFEVLRLSAGGDAAATQVDRFEHLTRNAWPLDQIEGSTIWHEWLAVRREQATLRSRLAHAERRLNEREPIPDRSDDKAQLINDLQQVYEDAVAADLPRADGQRYHPTRLLGAIKRARDGERDPVKVVTDTIRRRTEGLDILLGAGLVELTLEWLVLDDSKPYQNLFGRRSIELARARVDEFEREGVLLPGADPELEARLAAVLMSTAEIASWFADRLADHPDGYALPVVHGAQATLLGIEPDRAIVRRSSGTIARPPLRILAFRIREMANGRRFSRQSDLGYGSQRDTAVLGPLLADLPSVDVSDGVFRIASI